MSHDPRDLVGHVTFAEMLPGVTNVELEAHWRKNATGQGNPIAEALDNAQARLLERLLQQYGDIVTITVRIGDIVPRADLGGRQRLCWVLRQYGGPGRVLVLVHPGNARRLLEHVMHPYAGPDPLGIFGPSTWCGPPP